MYTAFKPKLPVTSKQWESKKIINTLLRKKTLNHRKKININKNTGHNIKV